MDRTESTRRIVSTSPAAHNAYATQVGQVRKREEKSGTSAFQNFQVFLDQRCAGADKSIIAAMLKVAWGAPDTDGVTGDFSQKMKDIEARLHDNPLPEITTNHCNSFRKSVRYYLQRALSLPAYVEEQFNQILFRKSDPDHIRLKALDLIDKIDIGRKVVGDNHHASTLENLKNLSYAWGARKNEKATIDVFGTFIDAHKSIYLADKHSIEHQASICFNGGVRLYLAAKLQPDFQQRYDEIESSEMAYEEKRRAILHLLRKEIKEVTTQQMYQRFGIDPSQAMSRAALEWKKMDPSKTGRQASHVMRHLERIISYYKGDIEQGDPQFQAACRFFMTSPDHAYLLEEQLDDPSDSLKSQVETAGKKYLETFSHTKKALLDLQEKIETRQHQHARSYGSSRGIPIAVKDLFNVELDRMLKNVFSQ